MARMLGRYCQGGCACRDCGDGQPDTRWRKRVEQRELERELEHELAEVQVREELGPHVRIEFRDVPGAAY